MIKAIYPVQCSCGHLFLERYEFKEVTDKGYIGFCWCGFCRTKRMVKPYYESETGAAVGTAQRSAN
jgi:LDH2 family malate/lactate/ureidoglycolate dehydrogenase